MINCIRDIVERSFNEYTQIKREQWVINRCGQAVLNMDMTFWTFETEKNMNESGNKGVKKYSLQCSSQLDMIVQLVRTNISTLDRCTIEALIVLDVHNRDVIV